MMDGASVKILGAGTAILDSVAFVPDAWLHDCVDGEKGGSDTISAVLCDKLLTRLKKEFHVSEFPGGAAANILSGLAALGLKTRLLGMVGDDPAGHFYLAETSSSGGDISSIRIHGSLPTGRCVCMVTPDSERTMRTCLAASDKLRAEDVSAKDFREINFVFLEGYLCYNLPLTGRILTLARSCRCPVAIDLSSFELVKKFRAQLLELARQCTVLFANREEACALADLDPGNNGGKSMEETNAELLDFLADLAPLAVLKLGPRGALIRSGNKTLRVDAPRVKALDTTGAGDTWQAGFLYGLLRGKPLVLSGKFASAAAAAVIQIPGARLPETAWKELKRQFQQWENEK